MVCDRFDCKESKITVRYFPPVVVNLSLPFDLLLVECVVENYGLLAAVSVRQDSSEGLHNNSYIRIYHFKTQNSMTDKPAV